MKLVHVNVRQKFAMNNVIGIITRNTDTLKQDQVMFFDINSSVEKYLNVTGKKRMEELLKIKWPTNITLFDEWKNQSDFEFGFVPLSDFIMTDRTDIVADPIVDPFELHKHVKNSGRVNFLRCRVPVKSQLNVPAWIEMLKGYWDVQLVELLKFGFPLDYNRSFNLSSEHDNHSYAIQYPSHVDAYLQEEITHGVILGPFLESPIQNSLLTISYM